MKDNQTIVLATLVGCKCCLYCNPTLEMPARHLQEEDSAVNGKNGPSLKTELKWTYAFNPLRKMSQNQPVKCSCTGCLAENFHTAISSKMHWTYGTMAGKDLLDHLVQLFHFITEETEAQRRKVIKPGSHSQIISYKHSLNQTHWWQGKFSEMSEL